MQPVPGARVVSACLGTPRPSNLKFPGTLPLVAQGNLSVPLWPGDRDAGMRRCYSSTAAAALARVHGARGLGTEVQAANKARPGRWQPEPGAGGFAQGEGGGGCMDVTSENGTLSPWSRRIRAAGLSETQLRASGLAAHLCS
jgi:hypothetical protein